MRRALPALALILALSACDGGGDPVQQALRETSAANHAATVREGEVTRRPVAAPEAGMPARMDAPSGATADEIYIGGMIEHHRSAVAMAEAALSRSRDPEIRRMAQAVRDTRTREIAQLQAWTPSAKPTP